MARKPSGDPAGKPPPLHNLPRVRIVNHIRRLRFERGEMTQQDLAERIGVTRQTVIAIESARYSPTLELAFRIALVFGVAMGDVFECGITEG